IIVPTKNSEGFTERPNASTAFSVLTGINSRIRIQTRPSPQDTSHGDTGSSPAHCIGDVSSGHLARVRRNTQLVESANGAIHQTTFAYQQVFNIDLQRQALTNRGKSR